MSVIKISSLFFINFSPVFTSANKVNFQNYFANKLIKWFAFEGVSNTRSTCFIWSNTLGYKCELYLFKCDQTLVRLTRTLSNKNAVKVSDITHSSANS